MRLTRAANDRFAGHSFPSTTAEVIEEHGDVELELPNGDETVGDVLGRLPDTTLETEEDARLAIYSALGEEAIGRKGYSDRDPTPMGEQGHDTVSL